MDLTAFRIVQEALTNVTKHAVSDTAHVRLVYSHHRLTITVTDEGATTVPAAPAPGHGFGLIGMRERAPVRGRPAQGLSPGRKRLRGLHGSTAVDPLRGVLMDIRMPHTPGEHTGRPPRPVL
ncbi:ATP-binding protein [Streptomyces sp. NBC_01483]|uniref:ATP-binding protein n=1 Tax=Streptomyces sp. NBC_01483 TaxID=2903883 RepID=UPI002E319475|nr:hypothetical protein [Streptomyces sp. NBC_01483]